ncbi:MAG: PilT/PilU family type 4a pilus ATPase [Dehalogenimonas sp.]
MVVSSFEISENIAIIKMVLQTGAQGPLEMVDVSDLIAEANKRRASDLLIVAGSPPEIRVCGLLEPLSATLLSSEDTKSAFNQLVQRTDAKVFERDLELDFGVTVPGVSRLRCNVFQQQGVVSLAIRLLPLSVPTIDDLELPDICKEIVSKDHGLIIVSGPTGSGKSTSMAAMIQHLNVTAAKHVVTVEDPIEYIHHPAKCVISQRQLGTDTHSFTDALKHVLRQNPDVILVGEMRDVETAAAVLTIADTGHLVLSTSHASSSHQALQRIIDLFPPHDRHQAYSGLASLLLGVLCQTLVPREGNAGRIAAVEIMCATNAVLNLIRDEKLFQIPNIIKTSHKDGMITKDEALVDLYRANKISRETVFKFCTDVEEVNQILGFPAVKLHREPVAG